MKKLLLTAGFLAAFIGLSSAQPSITDAFFTQVKYRGAFDGSNDWTANWAEFDPVNKTYPATTATLGNGNTTTGAPFEITGSMTLDAAQVYLLSGWVYVAKGGPLTIPAGTVIRGDKATQGAIIVEPGGKIIAQGTASNPIVFTSNQPAGSRFSGDWGGIILTGNAPTNQTNPKIEGGPRTFYGGTDPHDNSGALQYVRLEFPGVAFQPNQEINGLTMGGVGDGTTLDHIQVSYSGDDSYEWFGGTVNAKYLIAYKAVDDDFDTDYGYAGHVQFAVSLRDPDIADVSGSNGFESDNYNPGINAGNPSLDEPYTSAVFSNVSIFGPRATTSTPYDALHQHGAHLRRNTKLQIYNTVFAGNKWGIRIEGPSAANAQANELKINNSVIAGASIPFYVTAADSMAGWTSTAESAWFLAAQRENEVIVSVANLNYNDPFKQSGKPDFKLQGGSSLLGGSYWDTGLGQSDIPSIDDDFFTKVNYRGAFGSSGDWTANWSEFDPINKTYPATTATLGNGNTTSGTPFEITTNMTLDAGKVYLLTGWVYVTNGGTLTIPAGTVIRGDKATQGAIIVERGGKIYAQGTESNPIVFTSNQAPGNRFSGDWGGIILTGNAPTNQTDPKIEGGPRTFYGGTDPHDNSGSMQYVRLEFPGVAFQPNQEINGLTMGGVGDGTTLDHIQVSYSGDDSYEWFGGNVNAKYLIAYKGLDDDFDTDYGYAGRVQFAVSLRDPDIADVSGSNGFESDNYNPGINAGDPSQDEPYTTAVFSNVSIFGPRATTSTAFDALHQHGAHLRRNTKLQIYNTVFAGNKWGLRIEGPSVANAMSGDLKVRNSVVAGAQIPFYVTVNDSLAGWTTTAERDWFLDSQFENQWLTKVADLGYNDPFKQSGKPNFLLTAASVYKRGSYWDKGLGASEIPSIDDPFFTPVRYRGAFDGANDWTKNWAEFDPINKTYPATTATLGNGNTTSGTPFEITTTMTLDAGQVYLLSGWVYVANGGRLIIPAGTVIRGDKATQGAIIVEPGGQIIAQGTESQPIVFTSNQAAGNRVSGDWGGIILTGNAPTNQTNPKIEGGPRTFYGGDDPRDNSGVMQYVRLEFPGVAFQPNQEINGLTLGGVGDGTTLDHIQVSYSGDDSYEWFGGTVNAKYLIAYKAVDDDFDTDYGYAGRVQFGVTLRDPDIADVSGSNGFESDNYNPGINAADPTMDQPYTTAVFSNISVFGPRATTSTAFDALHQHGAHLRRNTKLQIYNTIFAGNKWGIRIEGPSALNAISGELKISNSVIAGASVPFYVTANDSLAGWTSTAESAWFLAAERENEVLTSVLDLNYNDPFKQTGKPNFLLAGGSSMLNGSYWDVITSVKVEPVAQAGITVYPNPFIDEVRLDTDLKVVKALVYNMNGQLVRQAQVNNNSLNLQGLNSGMYVLLLATADNKFYSQTIVRK